MLSILLLRHNAMLLKINERLLNTFLSKHNIDYQLTAPADFSKSDFKTTGILEKLTALLDDNNPYSVIFFEANLGFPGTNNLHSITLAALKHLIKQYPEATIILKSNSEGATCAAKKALLRESFPDNQIICADGLEQLSDEIAELLLDKANNENYQGPCIS